MKIKSLHISFVNKSLRNILIGFAIINCSNAACQDSNNLNVILKFQPLPALNIGIPRIQGGVEFLFKEKVGVEIGYGRRYLDHNIWIDETIDTATIKPSGDIKMLDITIYNVSKRLIKEKGEFKLDNFVGFSFRQIIDTKNKMTYYWPQNSDSMHSD